MLRTIVLLALFQWQVSLSAVLYSHPEAFQPTKGSVLTHIDIGDEMHVEMDIVIHSWPSSWANIFHCGTSNYYHPSLYLHPSSGSNGFRVHTQWNQHFWSGDALVLGDTYHVEVDMGQGSFLLTVNGEVSFSGTGSKHSASTNTACYASDPWWPTVDVTISNLIVADGAVTTAEPTTTTTTEEPTQSPTKDCSALHIDEFLVDCSTEFDGHGDRIESLESGGSAMMDTVTGHSQNIATLKAAVSDLENATTTMSAAIDAHGVRIDSIETEGSTMAAELTQHGQDIRDLKATVSGLANTTATLTAAATSIDAKMHRIMEHLDILGDYQTESGMTPIVPMPLDTSDYALYALAATNLIVVMCLAVYCVFVRATTPKYSKVAMYGTETEA